MRMTFFHLCRRCTTQQKGSSFLLTKDIASRYVLWSILKLKALNCVAWFFLRVRAAARTCSSFGTFEWWNIALARLLLVCRHLKKDLIWAFTHLMNSLSFWARWAFLYPLVVVPLLVVTDCVRWCPIHHYQQVLNAGDDMIGVEHLEEDSDGKALLKARRSAGSMSAFSGAGGRVYMEYRCRLCPFFLCIFIQCHIQPPFNWMQITCDLFFQHWEGEGCSEETQGPIKEASSV